MPKLDVFDGSLADSQASAVQPIAPESFDLPRYEDYEKALNERCEAFWKASSGVLVYRRMRVAEVFSEGCRDMASSLAWQLGALKESMKYKADVPNFLEPWYGLGVVPTAFGLNYVWAPGQAPAVEGKFDSTAAFLEAAQTPLWETPVGRHNLEMIAYFLDKTQGRLPMSYGDVQSPLNNLSNMIETCQFYTDFCLEPDTVAKAMDRIADTTIAYFSLQRALIGDALVKPGHGFSSSRVFEGFGQSDDSVTMLSPDLYETLCLPAMRKVGDAFGGTVFHSCGNWSAKKDLIVRQPGLKMADGAFSLATDPGANPTEGFAETFAGTGVVLNVRIVGSPEVVETKVRELWRPGMKLIVVTYCQDPAEQADVYDRIHSICQ